MLLMGMLKKASSGVLVAQKAHRTDPYASPFSLPAALAGRTFLNIPSLLRVGVLGCVCQRNLI